MIRYIYHKDPLKLNIKPLNDVIWKNDVGANIRIVRGGFPINFDGSSESVPSKDIQLTRGLVLSGDLQAVNFFKKKDMNMQGGVYMLDPTVQKFVVNEWVKVQPNRFEKNVIDKFQDEKWIIENSGGVFF